MTLKRDIRVFLVSKPQNFLLEKNKKMSEDNRSLGTWPKSVLANQNEPFFAGEI